MVYYCDECDFTAMQEWNMTNHKIKIHCICPFKSCQAPHSTAAALAEHLRDSHNKTDTNSKLTAGVIKVIHCNQCNGHVAFTNERKWNRHCVETHGRCPLSHCRFSCGDSQQLCTHLQKVHRKTSIQARKMCFLNDDPTARQGFTLIGGSNKNSLIHHMIQREAKKKQNTTVTKEVDRYLSPTAETSRADHFKKIAKKKMEVATMIKDHKRSTTDPTKNLASTSLARLEEVLVKLNMDM
jgi:hypothetical protein